MSQRRKLPHHLVVSLCSAFLLIASVSFSITINPGHISVARASSAVSVEANGLGQKPYMGWSSWSLESTTASGYGKNWLTEAHVKTATDIVHQQLQSHGYQYINIDAGWWMDFN